MAATKDGSRDGANDQDFGADGSGRNGEPEISGKDQLTELPAGRVRTVGIRVSSAVRGASPFDEVDIDANSAAVTSDNVKSLLGHARRIASQLQGMVLRDFGIELQEGDKLPTIDALVARLQIAFERQREINMANAKLNTVAVVANMATVVKNRALQKAVIHGRQQLEHLRNSVTTLENNVEDLSVETAVQKKMVERLRGSLDATRTALETSIGMYREEIYRQGQVLKKQNERLTALYSTRFNQDFILDFVMFMTSVWAVNTALVDIPIRTLLMVVGPYGRRKIFMLQAVKFVMLSLFLRTLRDHAIRYGLHNRVGGWFPYAGHIFRVFAGRFCRSRKSVDMATGSSTKQSLSEASVEEASPLSLSSLSSSSSLLSFATLSGRAKFDARRRQPSVPVRSRLTEYSSPTSLLSSPMRLS